MLLLQLITDKRASRYVRITHIPKGNMPFKSNQKPQKSNTVGAKNTNINICYTHNHFYNHVLAQLPSCIGIGFLRAPSLVLFY